MTEKIMAILITILGIFSLGFLRGKDSQQSKQIKINLADAINSKKRQELRKSDDIAIVKHRMQKYIRK